MTIKSEAKLVVRDEKRGFADLYIKNCIAYYASVQKPKNKYKAQNGEQEYSVTVFFDEAAKEALDDLGLNKEFKLAGKDKNKKRAIKFPLDVYTECEGLYGATFTLPSKTKEGKPRKPVVVWDGVNNSEEVLGEAKRGGELCPENIGNGSIISIKLSTYKNEDGALNSSINTLAIKNLVAFTGGTGGVVEDEEFGFAIDYNAHREQAEESSKVSKAAMFGDEEDVY